MAPNINICPTLLMLLLQRILITSAQPVLGGSRCSGCDDGCSVGLSYGGDLGCGPNYPDIGYGECGSLAAPPISFLPVPQPLPIRVPTSKPQSVSIPNIIVAMLPPNQNRIVQPQPICGTAPVVLPIPQPCPVPIRSGCDFCGDGV